MGNCLSELNCPAHDGWDMDHYSMWSIQDVMAAWDKYKTLHDLGDGEITNHNFAPFHITKRDFYEIFCDFSIQSTTGGIAVLPISDFDLFLSDEMVTQSGPKEILALEVFIILLLCCSTQQSRTTGKEKIRQMFRLFDFNNNGLMNYDEVQIVLIMMNNALMKTLETTPNSKEDMEHIAELLLKQMDSSSDAQIDENEFVSWASRTGNTRIHL
jgi:Ca2+-binding EF-hand superfamily protein